MKNEKLNKQFLFVEYAGNIGDAKDPEAREREQDRIMQLVDKFL